MGTRSSGRVPWEARRSDSRAVVSIAGGSSEVRPRRRRCTPTWQRRMVGTAFRKGQLPPGFPLEMTCPPSPSLFGIQFPGGGFFDAGRSATRAPTHLAAARSLANSPFCLFLAFWERMFVRFRWSLGGEVTLTLDRRLGGDLMNRRRCSASRDATPNAEECVDQGGSDEHA